MGHFKKVCQSKGDQAVHELEVEEVQEVNEGKVETVSIDSVHLNKNQSLITAKLETQAGGNTVEIPYKIDTGSEGNIMSIFMFKKNRGATAKINKKPNQVEKVQQNAYNTIRDMHSSNQIQKH